MHHDRARQGPAPPNNIKGRLAELLDKAEDGQTQAYWLLVTAEELRDELKEIADNPTVCGIKDLETALDSVAWLHNAAENAEAEFETLLDSIRGIEAETQTK